MFSAGRLQGGRMSDKKTEMIPVPIPTEVPAPPRLENIPLDILHSATVEMLIQQNEDLSSRLKVNIRRNSQLELKILELEKKIKHKEQKHQNLLAQNEIILEKENIWSSQKEEKARQLQSLESEINLLNTRYNELYTTSQQMQREQRKQLVSQQSDLETLRAKLLINQKLRRKAKDKLRHFLLEAAENFNSRTHEIKVSQSSNRVLKKSFESLKNEITEKETFFKEQLEALKLATKKSIEAQVAKNEELHFSHSQIKEKNLELNTEVQELTAQIFEEKKNRAKLTQVSQELTKLKNERIRTKRELQSQLEQSEEARLLEVNKTKQAESNLTELTKQFEEQKIAFKTCEAKILELAKDNKALSTQLESIQRLWIQAQEKLETEELKTKSLEKINRELSQNYKEERVSRAIKSSTTTESNSKETKPSNFQNRLTEVYASQYLPVTKGPEMDI